MSQVLWDVFTGSAPYRRVVARAMHPAFLARLAWSTVAANLAPGAFAAAAAKPRPAPPGLGGVPS